MFLRVFRFLPSGAEIATRSFPYIVAYLLLISVGSLGIGLTKSLLRASISLRFITQYTKLKPRDAILEISLAGTLSVLLYELVIFLEAYFLLYYRYKAFPRLERFFRVSLLRTALIVYLLSFSLSYLGALSEKLKSVKDVATLLLAFLAYFSLRIDYSRASYLNPLQVSTYFIIYTFLGEEPLRYGYVYEATTKVNMPYVYASLASRTLILLLASRVEIKYARGIRPEALL